MDRLYGNIEKRVTMVTLNSNFLNYIPDSGGYNYASKVQGARAPRGLAFVCEIVNVAHVLLNGKQNVGSAQYLRNR